MIPDRSRQVLLGGALALYCLLLLPRMLSAGMFLDGVVYASIARNMAEGYGSFWHPYYTETIYTTFYEHPPFGFWLQSWAYRVFGDSVYLEAFWGFFTGLCIFLGMSYVWSCHPPADSRRAGAWLPLVLCTLLPMTSWIFSNNLLENTMTVFMLTAVSLSMLSLTCSSSAVSLGCGIFAGLAIAGALLIKGPVALFPLVTPLCWTLYLKSSPWKGLTILGVMLGTVGLCTLSLWSSREAYEFLQRYLAQQIYASLAGTRELSGARWQVLHVVGREVLVPLLAGSLLSLGLCRSFRGAWSRCQPRTVVYRRLLYYLGLALAGSLPLMISTRQHRWYVFPALPFYALASAELFNHVACGLEDLVKRQARLRRSLMMATLALCAGAGLLMWLCKDSPQRHKDFYHDFVTQPLPIAARQTISVSPPALRTAWPLVANMQRHFKASLSAEAGHEYLLTTVEQLNAGNTPLAYRKIHPPAPAKYVLLQRDRLPDQAP